MTTNDFGFEVGYSKSERVVNPQYGWYVCLPHQCDAWDIAGYKYDPVPKEKAIEDLQKFIAEAQEALLALQEERQMNVPDRWWEKD